MPKHVISVGFEIPGEAAELVDFDADDSLLDADVVVFAPNLKDYKVDQMFRGKNCVTEEDSARILRASAHWRKELNIVLHAGRTVFVVLYGVNSVYIHTGQASYSGTGKSQRRTNLVDLFEPYSSVPISELADLLHISTGARIKTTKDIGALAPYWQEFGDATCYQAYLDKNIGTVALVTQTGDKMVGGSVHSQHWKGTMILLPVPDLSYMVEQRSEQRPNTHPPDSAESASIRDPEAEKAVGNQFVNALIELDHAIRITTEKTPTPAWASTEAYALGEEVRASEEVKDLEGRIAELQRPKLAADARLDAAANLRGLTFETGKPLEFAILEALRLMKFTAEGFIDRESEFDAVFVDPSGKRLLGEAEGKNDKAISIEKLDQLERNIQEDFKKREDSCDYAKGVLFANAFRLRPPEERGDYFTAKCVAGAKRLGVALVRTPDLFFVARFLKENPNPAFSAACRQAILDAKGEVVVFPRIPMGTSNSISA